MDIVNINSFLKFGYFLDYKNPNFNIDLSSADKSAYAKATESELIHEGIRLWKNAIDKQFNSNEMHAVPLSGGLDSRAILCTILEHTSAKNIYTYTFGTPSTFDFEIGNKIAKELGTNHIKIPLTEFEYKMDDLIEVSKRIDHQCLLFLHPPIRFIDEYFASHRIWSGAIIDVFFGRHFHRNLSKQWDAAIRNSFRENIYSKSVDMCNIHEDDFFKYVEIDDDARKVLELEHIIDLKNRQIKFVAPHVLMSGYKYGTLFTDFDLVKFALSIDNRLHIKQYLYKEMFLKAYPKMFSLPTKSNYGFALSTPKVIAGSSILFERMLKRFLRRNSVNRNTNYIDFCEGIRNRKDLHDIVSLSVNDLSKRGIVDWVDMQGLLKQHMAKVANHAKALLTLTSLEIHLKAGKRL